MASTTQLFASVLIAFLAATVSAQEKLTPVIDPVLVLPPLTRTCPSFAYDAFYNLEAGTTTPSPYVTTVEGLTGTGCNTKGVLKIALASIATPNRRRVLVDLFFKNPTGFTFNLGDSKTNNGYAGDAHTQSHDAEIHSSGTTVLGYLSDHGGSAQAFRVNNMYSTRLTLIAGDGHVVWLPNDHNNFNYYYNPNFFALNGQPDTEGSSNYDLYLGMNKVVQALSSRTGSGLCKVGIKFLPEY